MDKIIRILAILLLLGQVTAQDVSILYGSNDPAVILKSVNAAALGVTLDEEHGILGNIDISLIDADPGLIVFDEHTFVDPSTIISVLDAVKFAENYSGRRGSYFISYGFQSQSVSGGSTGSTVATGIISLLVNRSLKNDSIITGQVLSDGSLMMTGAVLQKTLAAGEAGFQNLIVPEGQAATFIYEKNIDGYGREYIMSRHLNITQYAATRFGMRVNEASDMKQVLDVLIWNKSI